MQVREGVMQQESVQPPHSKENSKPLNIGQVRFCMWEKHPNNKNIGVQSSFLIILQFSLQELFLAFQTPPLPVALSSAQTELLSAADCCCRSSSERAGMLCTEIRAGDCFENPQGKGEGQERGALAEQP